MNEAEEKKAYEDWLHQSPEFADTIISAWDVWLGRAALSAPAVPQWVPVSERLPSEHVTCALRLRGDYITIGWASYWHGARTDFARWNFPHDSDEDVAHEITHWMHLPAAPSPQEPQT